MARLSLPVILILSILWLSSGCLPEVTPKSSDPSQVSMARHIHTAHGVLIGTNTAADVLVFKTNDMIRVVFNPQFLQRTGQDCLTVMSFPKSEKTLSKSDYLNFLDQLHAYLTMTAPR